MSFVFPSWSTAFSPAFHEDAKAMLEGALNKGNKPPVIQGRIEVVELSMGKEPPTLTLLEIGDLSLDRFRGILRLGYSGDAWLEVRCRVQANPLSHNPNLSSSSTLPLSTPLLASQPLLVPMTLRLSKLHLRAILILVVSASKGITLVFKNDPLQNVDVSSTFDSVEVIRGYLQQEIEGQLREMFREDLPGIIHRLSQRWFHGTGVGGKVETPYKDIPTDVIPEEEREGSDDGVDESNPYGESSQIFPPHNIPATTSNQEKFSTPRRQSLQAQRSSLRRRRSSTSNSISESPTSYTVFPDIEDYDPTYGLRPEGVPTHSGYEAFGRLWEKSREGGNRGLGSLMSMPIQNQDHDGTLPDYLSDTFDEEDEDEEDEIRSFDMVEMDDVLRSISHSTRKSRRQSSLLSAMGSKYGGGGDEKNQIEWETFPAVGGGVITRPRVYHSQSQIRAPSEAGGNGRAMPSPAGTATGGSVTARASSVGGASSTVGSLRMRPFTPSTPSIGIRSPTFTQSQAAPSSLRRMVTSHSDVFLSSSAQGIHGTIPRSETFSASAIPRKSVSSSRRPSRTGTGGSSSATRTGTGTGSSWDTIGHSTNPTSTLPSSKPLSITSKHPSTRQRVPSVSLSGTSPGNGSFPPRNIGPGGITLPLNNSVSQLATLSHSAHTLSPYARGHEHIAVRSFPHLGRSNTGLGMGMVSSMNLNGLGINDGGGGAGGITPRALIRGVNGGGGGGGDLTNELSGQGMGVMKARRKRIHRLNTTKKDGPPNSSQSLSQAVRKSSLSSNSRSHSNHSGDIDEIDNYIDQNRSLPKATNMPKTGRGMSNVNLTMEKRPNMRRNPDSRTSYGFPQS
ncbi:mitochondrial distribution and morphology protein 34 [Kwoniella mangroviensis CBS 10435]|uniref:Mitochondrial distribution and morphology protein 34 n=1 Tax=Kwoniella mangroviensis CBS 10435 TaxID=1331196 RepID=A0A1B9J300_9TREE|nr:mitochondrial distribution and morphology protein 34 [Kwoniella mangroviensis CBS 8507]OCF62158.1 mitochondrial distribution and morphology protein 34 [Kwoniella mangroviensis CBS 10435]OCF64459.1 mitochondrial distribution and morphology protein 34 [Kwoniella mangroviensis CBS 8507]